MLASSSSADTEIPKSAVLSLCEDDSRKKRKDEHRNHPMITNQSSPEFRVISEGAQQLFILLALSAASFLESKENSGGQKTLASDVALENFKQRWELFRVACDQAEEFVESVKQRIGSECLVDEATGSVAQKPGQPVQSGLPPISAVLELVVVHRNPTLQLLLMLDLLKMLVNRKEAFYFDYVLQQATENPRSCW
ncbi:unnamed protein product [Fraxinus pennsylvanica]|uniref:Uncharacterized protein n=1 Tax=Fraxinus pennsylvanica TaxID=56036 RepID=A0AAD1ZMW2_9LAMI|nr:unnamed protein product [Fraxinus pennsylvanica]